MVSVIVPVYNVEKYLRRCIESIVSQVYLDIEIILVDDGSTDNCGAICDAYAQMDERIRVLHFENGGLSFARNAALNIAKGDYIAFCDSDDYWHQDYLQRVMEVFAENDVDTVAVNYTRVDESGGDLGGWEHRIGLIPLNTDESKYDYLITSIYKRQDGWEVWRRVFKAQIIRDNHIRFYPAFAEDLGFTMEYMLCAKSAYGISDTLYYYTLRHNSIMRSSESIVRLDDMCRISRQIEGRFKNKICTNGYKKKYAVIHFFILYLEIKKLLRMNRIDLVGKEIKNISDMHWHKNQMRDLFLCRTYLAELFGKRDSQRLLLMARYCMHGKWKWFCYESAIAYRWLISKV